MKYLTLIQWQDPTGKFHEVGDVVEIDERVITDLADLLRSGTLQGEQSVTTLTDAAQEFFKDVKSRDKFTSPLDRPVDPDREGNS